MTIPYIYVYLSSEVLIALMAISIILFIRNKKLTALIEKLKSIISDLKSNKSVDENSFDLSSDYNSYLDQELERNNKKIKSFDTIPLDEEDNEITETNEKHKNLLIIRKEFLNTEKSAIDHSDNENSFWEHLYSNIQDIRNQFLTSTTEIINKEEIVVNKIINKSTETILTIEPQGKKIDAEVNKLKDIIYNQENSLSALSKALKEASKNHDDPEVSESLEQLHQLVSKLERNVEESRVCMEILESENDRLQGELTEFETRFNAMSDQIASQKPAGAIETESQSSENVDQLKNTLEQQNQKITQLAETVDNLQLEAEQAEKLKATLKEFTRGSQEMMTCITILEEENEHLLDRIDALQNNTSQSGETDDSGLTLKIGKLEEEIIKKDVAYAKLQDEYLSMEKEYLSMYEAMHNNE